MSEETLNTFNNVGKKWTDNDNNLLNNKFPFQSLAWEFSQIKN